MANIGIIGCGAWGATIATILIENSHNVLIWGHNEEIVSKINNEQRTPLLTDILLPKELKATTDLEFVVKKSDYLILAVASSYVSIIEQINEIASKPILSLVKGLLEDKDYLFISDYIESVFKPNSLAILSGPNLAKEIANKLPAVSVISSKNEKLAQIYQGFLSNNRFRIYTSKDVRGVELGGILKNIMAIAAGIADGLELGDNTKSALMTRGLQEMIRLGAIFEAKPETFFGLSGLGDLITTCSSKESRNWNVGFRISQNNNLDTILNNMTAVAEGVKTTKIIYKLALEKNIDMPITKQVYKVLFEKKDPFEAIDALMTRELKSEQ
jgi:glycerol-3-phosphate dehydrogenase (NAD(P)+)